MTLRIEYISSIKQGADSFTHTLSELNLKLNNALTDELKNKLMDEMKQIANDAIEARNTKLGDIRGRMKPSYTAFVEEIKPEGKAFTELFEKYRLKRNQITLTSEDNIINFFIYIKDSQMCSNKYYQ